MIVKSFSVANVGDTEVINYYKLSVDSYRLANNIASIFSEGWDQTSFLKFLHVLQIIERLCKKGKLKKIKIKTWENQYNGKSFCIKLFKLSFISSV